MITMTDIYPLTQEEMSYILYDAREGDLETLKNVFEEIGPSALTTIQDDITLSTPVHMAAANGHFEVVEYLLSIITKEEAIKITSHPNELGNTPLHWASFNGHLPIVKLLCEKYSADPFLKNSSGHDSIYESELNNKEDVETWFLQNFAIEDDYKFSSEETGEGDDVQTKITFTPGNESREADERAREAQIEAQEKKQDAQEKKQEKTQETLETPEEASKMKSTESVEKLTKKTESLKVTSN